MISGAWIIGLLIAAILFIILVNVKTKLHIFLVLLLASYFVGLASGMDPGRVVDTIASGFGGTLKSIGIVILFGCVIATFLEKSGAIFSMVDAVLKFVGRARAALAVSLTGFIVSIPVFCDSGFVILSPIARGIARALKKSSVIFGVALSTGLYATHCLVPPTPGPIACAALLEADLGLVIALGLIVSIPAMLAGLWYATRKTGKYYVEPKIETTEEDIKKRFKKLPSAFKSFIPIVVPIILICARSVVLMVLSEGPIYAFFNFLGHPITALFIGVAFAFTLVPPSKEVAAKWVERGLMLGAIIIFITGAGGAFGAILRESGVGSYIGESLAGLHLWLFLPFLISAMLKTAQGSSTVALITTPAIVGPMLPALGLTSPVALALTVLAIGAGSMVVSHVNDSYFWVVTRFTGITDVSVGYRTQTVATFVEGMAAIVTILILGAILI